MIQGIFNESVQEMQISVYMRLFFQGHITTNIIQNSPKLQIVYSNYNS